MPSESLVTRYIEALVPYSPGKPVEEVERELGISGSVKLASNENPLGPSPAALEAIARHAMSIHRYPDGGSYYLKEGLAAHLGVTPGELLVGNGSNDVIELLARTFLSPGDHAVMPEKSFIIYRLICQGLGRSFTEVPLQEMRTSLDGLAEAITPKTKMVFIANPNNPTGTYVKAEEMERFLQDLPPQVIVVLDEAYAEYATASDYPDGLKLKARFPRLVISRTFSKAYGLAGLRCGYAVADPQLVGYCNRLRQPFNVSSLAQHAAAAALKDQEFIAKSRRENQVEMERLKGGLDRLGLKYQPSQGNFLMVDMGKRARPVFDELLLEGVIVRPLDCPYGLDNCLRVSVGTRSENERFLAAMSKLSDKHGE